MKVNGKVKVKVNGKANVTVNANINAKVTTQVHAADKATAHAEGIASANRPKTHAGIHAAPMRGSRLPYGAGLTVMVWPSWRP